MTESLEIKEIMNLLPHRYPFLLVDRVIEYEKSKTISAYKNVTYNEHFFQGHFPNRPVMPGVLIIEAMAQAGGVLAYLSRKDEVDDNLIYFMSIEKAKFRRPVVPGDRLDFKVEVLRTGSRYWKLRGEAFVEEKLAAEAEFTAVLGTA